MARVRLLSPLAVVALAAAMLLAGCAVSPAADPPRVTDCDSTLAVLDAAIAEAGVRDGAAARIEGFPALRVDRFLASFATDALDASAVREWVARLEALGAEGRRHELMNLPATSRGALQAKLPRSGNEDLEQVYRRCARETTMRDLSDPGRIEALKLRAKVPDDYDDWKRVVGLYWITRLAFAKGIEHWHSEVREQFARPLASLAAESPRIAYSPPAPAGDLDVAAVLSRSRSPGLRIPDLAGVPADALFRRFAPTFVVGHASGADRPGRLGWIAGAPAITQPGPFVYRRMSHARRGDDVLLQLEYWIWFPERPKSAAFDLLGGRLDAVVWRVTLAPDGEPWVYDTIHACGCYHLFFPTVRAIPRAQPDTLDENAFVPQVLPRVAGGAPIEVWLAAGTHYVERVVAGDSGNRKVPYAFLEDSSLSSLALGDGGRRSLFREDGIVAGTERAERWLFWPMGIREPGAMRQWGRHPTAFVGRRHFDDPGLIPEYFDLH